MNLIARFFRKPCVHSCEPEPRFMVEYFPGFPRFRARWFNTLKEAQAWGEECYRRGVVPELTDRQTGIRYPYWHPSRGLAGEVKESAGCKYVAGSLQ